ncbi:unnamed protein product [Polarella glacialis]|uniref:Uncharacterized protein n=1 Tax=Polarella glacialis TaxID=89957 RepID=A0A813E3Y3_POLGL|nr:unnamed protein product [Polarella glacialis]
MVAASLVRRSFERLRAPILRAPLHRGDSRHLALQCARPLLALCRVGGQKAGLSTTVQAASLEGSVVVEGSSFSKSLDVHKVRPVRPLSITSEVLLFESDVDVQELVIVAQRKCVAGAGLAVTGFYALLASADPEPMWHIPPAFQRLMLGIIVLDNPEQSLASYIEVGESVLSLTLVISFDSVLQDLESGVGPRLASLGRRGGDKSVAAVCRGLEATASCSENYRMTVRDSDDGVRREPGGNRRTAVNVLHAVAEKEEWGDLFAISEVVGRLQHGIPAVRCAAAEALATVVEMGDAAAVAEVMKLVEHPEDGVRGTAIQALLSITERGDPNVTFALRAFLEHKDVSVRCAALEALALVVQQGDTACSASASALLDDPDQLVRCRAVHALAFASKTGDASAICTVQVCLTDPDELVRCAAVEALAFIAEKDDPTAIRLICKRLEDTHCHVRSLAVQALASLAARGSATAIGPVSALLRNTMANIRCASVEALACIAERGDVDCIAKVSCLLEDPDGLVRCAAVQTLASIVQKGSQPAITAVCRLLEDSDMRVRRVVVQELPSFAERGDPAVLAEVIGRLTHRDERIQRCAVEALACIAVRGDSQALDAVTELLRGGPMGPLRLAAVKALACLAEEQGDPSSAGAMPPELLVMLGFGAAANSYILVVLARRLIRNLATRHVDRLSILPMPQEEEKEQEGTVAEKLLLALASIEERLAVTPEVRLQVRTGTSERWLSLVKPLSLEELEGSDLVSKASFADLCGNLRLLDINVDAGTCHDHALVTALMTSSKIPVDERAEARADVGPSLAVPDGDPAPGVMLSEVLKSDADKASQMASGEPPAEAIEQIGRRSLVGGLSVLAGGLLFVGGERARDADGVARWNNLKLPG